MSTKPSGAAGRPSSRFSRFKSRISSVLSPSLPTPPSTRLRENGTGRPDILARPADGQLYSASTSYRKSISNVSIHSAADSIPDHQSSSSNRFIHHLEVSSAYQDYSSTYLAPPSPLQLPRPQEHVDVHTSSASPGTYRDRGMFRQSHNFSIMDSTFIDNMISMDNFMEKLLQQTIIGAEFDSSDRDPPPRCHPGTRLMIVQRCLDFIVQNHDKEKLRWVVGPAGVGKSAVMQIVAEKAPDDVIFASIFLSVNGRGDGTKVIMTIAYQLAVKCESYHQFVRNEITRDPSLLRKSLSVHFKRFIIEPFIYQRLFDPPRRFLVLLDGLDECDNPLIQQKLLELISDFCITYPTSPIVWIIASRPELHITSFFEKAEVQAAYTKEEIEVDSDEACEDVQRYLRDELKKIKHAYPTLRHKREWPSELEFTKIASAAGGLFAYASTVIRYIGDPYYRDPAAQLRGVLAAIDASLEGDMSGKDHPMAQLDALYKRILSNIPDDVMINTRKLLLLYSNYASRETSFRFQCNTLGLTEDAAYGAVCHLYAVMKVPEPDKADAEPLEYFHKSFEDFLSDFNRSGFSDNVKDEVQQLKVQTSLRIVEEVPANSNGMTSGKGTVCRGYGHLKTGPGFCNNIRISWPGDERFRKTDDELRLELYRDSMRDVCNNFSPDSCLYGAISFFHALTTRFTVLENGFLLYRLRDSAFNKFCPELKELGKLKQVPLRALDYAAICGRIELHFTSPIGTDHELSDPWNSSCKHVKREVDGLSERRGWSTAFNRFLRADTDTKADVPDRRSTNVSGTKDNTDIPRFNIVASKSSHWGIFRTFLGLGCDYSSRRLARYFIDNRDAFATVFVDSTEMCYVELSFVDPDDGVSEWRYRFFHSGLPTNIDV